MTIRSCYVTLILCFCFSISVLGKEKCTEPEAQRAESEASSLHSWSELYRSYKNFAACDDAAIGEGYSATVARLLSDNWGEISDFKRLSSRDKEFKNFVLRHIDQLMSEDQEKKIRSNAATHCPAGSSGLCQSILARIRNTAF